MNLLKIRNMIKIRAIILFIVCLIANITMAQNNENKNWRYKLNDKTHLNIANIIDTNQYIVIKNDNSFKMISRNDSIIYHFSPFISDIVISKKKQQIKKVDLFYDIFKKFYISSNEDTSKLFIYSIKSIKNNSNFYQIYPKQIDSTENNFVLLNLAIILKIENEFNIYILNSFQKVRKLEEINYSLFNVFEEYFNK